MDQVTANMGVLDGWMTKHPSRDWLDGGGGRDRAHLHVFREAYFGATKWFLIIVIWEVSIGTKGGVG